MALFTPYYRCTIDMITDVKFKKLYHKYGKDVFAIYWMWHMILTQATKMSGAFNQSEDQPHDDLSLLSIFDVVAITHGIDFIRTIINEFSSSDYRLLVVDDEGFMRVNNWEKYQHTTLSSTPRTQKFREKEKQEPIITEILEMFNKITRKNLKIKTEAYRKLVRGRLDEGHTKEDFEKVITWKHNQWSTDDKMRLFIRPDTLFRPSHFDTYLNEIPKGGVQRVLTENDVTTAEENAVPSNEAVFKVRDIYGRTRVITQAQFDKAEEGFFNKI